MPTDRMKRRSFPLFLKRWPIARRLSLGFLVAALVAGLVAGIAFTLRAQTLSTQASLYHQTVIADERLGDANTNLLLIEPTLNNLVQDARRGDTNGFQNDHYVLSRLGGQFLTAFQGYVHDDLLTAQPEVAQVLEAEGQGLLVSRQSVLISSVERTWELYQAAQEHVLDLVSRNLFDQAELALQEQAEAAQNDASSALNDLIQFNKQVAQVVEEHLASENTQNILFTSVAGLLAFLSIVLVGWYISYTILQPLREVYHLSERVMQGKFDTRAKVLTEDELGQVTQTLNRMLDNVAGLLFEIRQQRDELLEQTRLLDKTLRVASRGDLRLDLELRGTAAARLVDNFNQTLQRFRQFLSRTQTILAQKEAQTRSLGTRATALSRKLRLESARFTGIDASAEALAEHMHQARQQATEVVVAWQTMVTLLARSRATLQRMVKEAQAAHPQQQGAASAPPIAQEAQELHRLLETFDADLTEQARKMEEIRVLLSHTQTAQEIGRATQEMAKLLQLTGAEAEVISRAAESLLESDKLILANMASFKLSEGGSAPQTERGERM